MSANSIYSDLNPSRQEIRLLEIITTAPNTIYKMRTVSLLDSPTFCALSYVWGSPVTTEEIIVNNSTIPITQSLADALKYIPMHWESIIEHEDTEPLLLWADAICINQNDTQEKNHQVPLMKRIYSSAEHTFCSLISGASSLIVTAIDTLNLIATRAAESGFDPDLGEQEAKTDWMLDELECFGPDPDWREGMAIKQTHSKALYEFLSLPYWTRVWIFQEIVVSKHMVVFHTSRAMEFSKLLFLLHWFDALSVQTRPEEIDLTLWELITLVNFRLVLVQMNVARDFYRQQHANVLMLGLVAGSLESSNPKDYIYALLGITGMDIAPDYSTRTSVAAVYIEFFEKLFNFMLGFDSRDSMCRSCCVSLEDLIYFAGFANKHPEVPTLPSWVPNFPGFYKNGGECNRQYPYPSFKEHTRYLRILNGWMDSIFIQNQSLFIPAVFISSINDISDVFTMKDASWQQYALSVFRILSPDIRDHGTTSSSKQKLNRQHPLVKLASALWGKKINANVWESPEALRVVRVLQCLLLNFPRIESNGDYYLTWYNEFFGYDFLDKIYLGIDWLVELSYVYDLDSSENDGSETPHSTKTGKDLVEEIVDALKSEGPEKAASFKHPFPDIIRFIRKVMAVSDFEDPSFFQTIVDDMWRQEDIRVARTVTGELGLVPHVASKGDSIVLLGGSGNFHLIRKIDNHYVLIGPARFLEELADPKMDRIRSGEEKFEMIELQ
ncbi:hypothetical protein NHQ30_001385 [Ciborinia camelliae]|nr:hypothetical protein NHQ30_001385 [Ciborinia camelliae]